MYFARLLFQLHPATTAALLLLAAGPARADLANPQGLWQLDASLAGALPAYPALNAASLSAGTDYSFASDGAGYQFLQTQIFATPAKRLTVTNNTGANGGPGATRTNQWTVVMDVKFDALQPYAGFLQLDPGNAADVTFYIFSANNLTGSVRRNVRNFPCVRSARRSTLVSMRCRKKLCAASSNSCSAAPRYLMNESTGSR